MAEALFPEMTHLATLWAARLSGQLQDLVNSARSKGAFAVLAKVTNEKGGALDQLTLPIWPIMSQFHARTLISMALTFRNWMISCKASRIALTFDNTV